MLRTLFVLVVALSVGACAEQHENPQIGDHEVKLTFLHTSDIHSRLLPYRMQVSYTDEKMGLRQENEPFGGVARIAHIINTERARARRSLYVDSGDVFQGAPIFNVFRGEAEFRAMSYLHPDAMVIGNHEFDAGLANVVLQAKNWMAFPFIVANYAFMPDNELKDYMSPYVEIGRAHV